MDNAIILGTFDGLHKGHRSVISAADGFNITAVTFEIPPKAVLSGGGDLLMTPKRRFDALCELGVSQVEVLDFKRVRDTDAVTFLDEICEKFSPRLIACGFNYRFGKGAAGDTNMLSEYCAAKGIRFRCSDPVAENGTTVSSSMIRDRIRCGDSSAFGMVYGGFSFAAPVIKGDRRGRTLGFPTVNQKYPDCLVKPKFGVYAVKVCIDGKVFDGIANIGHRPTYRTDDVFSETYIKDFSGDLYGKTVTVKPVKFIREERKFSSAEELQAAIRADVDTLSEN